MDKTGIFGFILIAINVAFSYKGFKNNLFFEGYKFEVDKILIQKDYKRIITSGFLHSDWTHLIFNMFSLYAFSGLLEYEVGGWKFLLIYFTSLVGGDLLSLFVHRSHGDYSAIGASGAVCGVIFASIALFPGMGVGFFGLPFSIPSWLYGIVYILYTIYGIKSSKDNIGHDAHLGGALVGMVVALLLQPTAFAENYITILVIAIPTILFIYLIVSRPHILIVDNVFSKKHNNHYRIDHKYNEEKVTKQQEIDKILDKINKKGIDSLSAKEKEILEKFS
jgi:membrane associated rhomboid family serine protease